MTTTTTAPATTKVVLGGWWKLKFDVNIITTTCQGAVCNLPATSQDRVTCRTQSHSIVASYHPHRLQPLLKFLLFSSTFALSRNSLTCISRGPRTLLLLILFTSEFVIYTDSIFYKLNLIYISFVSHLLHPTPFFLPLLSFRETDGKCSVSLVGLYF